MPLRLYFVTISGTGTAADAFRPVARLGVQRDACDARANPGTASGEMALVLNTDATEHASMLATVGVTYPPFEDALGVALLPGQATGDVSAANRTTITTQFDARHIPIQDLVGSDPIRKAWRRAFVRFLCRQLLGPDDWTEGFDTLVSAIPVAKRTAIRDKLTAAGYDMSTIAGSDTIREAIRKVCAQQIRMSRTGSDG